MFVHIWKTFIKREWNWEILENGQHHSGCCATREEAITETDLMLDRVRIGYLVNGHFQCNRCSQIKDIPVYYINVRPYSAVCCICKEIVINGATKADGSPLTLF